MLIIAAYAGRRGHPIVLPEDLAAEVASWPASHRLSELREREPRRVLLVETGEPGVLVDVDTPADLERARNIARGRNI
jgi:molybdenum cofactor cytidylyltransferase